MSGFASDYAMLAFMFAPDGGYLITTFGLPLRKQYTPVTQHQNLPQELSVEVNKPGTRILSASIYREGIWCLCLHRMGLESLLNYSQRLSSTLQDIFDNLKSNPQGANRTPKFVAFGESPGSFCMILIDNETIKLGIPEDCDNVLETYNDALRQKRERPEMDFASSKGIALGVAGSWIIYDGDNHLWGGPLLPQGLVEALELGERENWSIKTAELSIFNPEEYFLVYRNGKVWYNVHHSFENKLRSVVLAWALMQELEEVTFTNIVSNENIAYFELFKKLVRSAIKAYPPLFNEEVAHYKRQNFDSKQSIGDEGDENDVSDSSEKRTADAPKISRFIQNASKVQVKRSQGSISTQIFPSYGQLLADLLWELARTTFSANIIVWRKFANVLLGNNVDDYGLKEGKQCVQWTCGCGQTLFDDFEVLNPDALKRLEIQLNQYGQSNQDRERHNQNSQVFRTTWSWITNRFLGSTTSPRAPDDTEGQPAENIDVVSQVADIKAEVKPLHLLCCMPTTYKSEGFLMRYESLHDIATDNELFKLLRKAFYGHNYMFFSIFSIKRAKSIRIVKFMLAPSNYVEILDHSQSCQGIPCTCLPPRYLVEPSISATYICEPLEAAQRPPIGINFLKHQFNNPTCQGKEEIWFYNQVPKWTAGILKAPNDYRVKRWGIHIESELHKEKLRLIQLVFAVAGSVTISLVYKYSSENPDLQTAVTIIGSWLGLCMIGFAAL